MISALKTFDAPDGIALDSAFVLQVRAGEGEWASVPTYAVDVATINPLANAFHKHPIAVASIDVRGPVTVRARYTPGLVTKATVRPASRSIPAIIDDGSVVTFTLDRTRDVMLQINGDKWKALHLLVNEIDDDAPMGDCDDVWYFGPGLNNGSAYSLVEDGDLLVPSGKTVYLAGGAFLSARITFKDVSKAALRGHGFIYQPRDGAVLIERSSDITVQGVTSLSAGGFSLTTGEAHGVHIDHYRSFSSSGNGDGVDFFCSTDVLVENCFLRNSDDTVAIYGHRWNYSGDTRGITVRDSVLLPDIAHAVQIGTHGAPDAPEHFSDIRISNIDVLDHEERQVWYQGVLSVNAGDANLIEGVVFEDIRVERITRGQLINIRVMQNAMWTTAPGRGVRDVTVRNVSLDTDASEIVNPSMILGYDAERKVENVRFENLRIGGRHIHVGMSKPRWFMVADQVPLFANEHVSGLNFK
ncbi:glycoside hydrolase family 28 protein [Plectosphaerella cucumerina]|uniref:Glycoside hydrolase family 28 protein n=1 Tax=Plectosphaerella cucumerina TaxID=40658 RepID=A0A8K0X630_9PEZI|nr:glycoside hydrolase family 28 protein [Plectosphaerella cucumerina]